MPTLSFHLDKRYAVLAGNLSSNLVHQRWLSYVGSTWFNLFTIYCLCQVSSFTDTQYSSIHMHYLYVAKETFHLPYASDWLSFVH